MLIVDTALQKRLDEKNPIKIGIVGAGYSGKNIAYQIINFFPAIQVVAIANRTWQTLKQQWNLRELQIMAR